uniref:Uncharacterized protein n=1 Tax=Anguilla anguilla TaxID=7936 RepID=A0A0E9VGL3_ANGAN
MTIYFKKKIFMLMLLCDVEKNR